ncbi:MAG: hypothetical protein WAM79_12935 [Candidatus Sulfotelmatobacter sp.]
MPANLHRYYDAGYVHFITTSCYPRTALVNEAQKAEMRLRGLHSVRWLAASRMCPWYPLAENRGEWGSLDRGGTKS